MTPPEKPDTTGPAPEPRSERTSVIAPAAKADPAADTAGRDGNGHDSRAPGAPGGPAEPAGSTAPTGPAGPAGSVGPSSPSAPTSSAGPTASGAAVPATSAVPAGSAGTPGSVAGRPGAATPIPPAGATKPDDGANHTPPPWQRVTADDEAQTRGGDADTTQALPTPGNGRAPSAAYRPDEEATVSVPRPVVTGAAAGRLFAPSHTEDPTPTGQPRAAVSTPTTDGGSGLGGLRTTTQAPPSALRRPGRGPRRANLQVKRFDPWSVLKLSLVLGVALFFVWLVAVGALYAVLDGMGVWDKLNGISSELLNASNEGTSSGPLISAGRVFGIAAIIGAINIVLFSALATVGAFVYNVSADLAGGLEVTLAERE